MRDPHYSNPGRDIFLRGAIWFFITEYHNEDNIGEINTTYKNDATKANLNFVIRLLFTAWCSRK